MEARKSKLLFKASAAGLKRDLFEPWCERLTPIIIDTAYDLISEFICLQSRIISPVVKKNPKKFFKFLGFVREAIEDLMPLTKKFKHLSYLQVALNFARSKFLRKRKYRCSTVTDCWRPVQLEEPKPRLDITETNIEDTKPLQIYVFNCANFSALTAALAQVRKSTEKDKLQLLFHGTTWTNAESIAKGINIDNALPNSEFSVNGAFYLTNDFHQAHLHAMSKTAINGYDDPAVVIYGVPEGHFDRVEHLKLQDDPALWQTVVARCRDATDSQWREQWGEFINDYESVEGPVPVPVAEDPDPEVDPKPKRNSWQVAILNDQGAERLAGSFFAVVVWGDKHNTVPHAVVTPVPAPHVVREPQSHMTEVIDIDMIEQISPITTPKKVVVK